MLLLSHCIVGRAEAQRGSLVAWLFVGRFRVGTQEAQLQECPLTHQASTAGDTRNGKKAEIAHEASGAVGFGMLKDVGIRLGGDFPVGGVALQA